MPNLKLNVPLPNKGIVVDRPGEFIDPRGMSNTQNIQISRNLIEQRNGSANYGVSLGEKVMGMSELEQGINTFFVRVGRTKAQVFNKTTEVWSSIANAALTGNADQPVDFAFPLLSAVKTMVYTNNLDNIRKYNGTGNDADLGGTPPLCKYLIDFKTYLVLVNVTSGGTSFPTRVQWSRAGSPELWTGGNSGSNNLLEDSLEITGVNRFGNDLSIHKESAIYLGQLVDTSEVFRFTRKETGVGTIAHGSIQNLPDGTQIFLASDGLRLFNGYSTVLIPSGIIDELRDSVNPEWKHMATSVLVRDLDEYWIGIPMGSQEIPETVYKYNYRTGQVYKDPRSSLMFMTLSKRITDQAWDDDSDSWDSDTTRWDNVIDLALHKAVIFGHDDGVTTQRTSDTNDVSAAIDSIMDTKDFTIDDIQPGFNFGQLVRWQGIDLWAKGNAVSLYYSTDSGSTWTLIGTQTLGSDYPADDSPDIFYFDVVGSKIRFRFRNSTLSQTWTLKKYALEFKVRERRK